MVIDLAYLPIDFKKISNFSWESKQERRYFGILGDNSVFLKEKRQMISLMESLFADPLKLVHGPHMLRTPV